MKLHINIPHDTTKESALERVKNFVRQAEHEHFDKIDDLEEKWEGDRGVFRCRAGGHSISGVIIVNASHIELDLELPFAARFFKDKIKKTVYEKVKEILENNAGKVPADSDATARFTSAKMRKVSARSHNNTIQLVLSCGGAALFLLLCSKILSRQRVDRISRKDAEEALRIVLES